MPNTDKFTCSKGPILKKDADIHFKHNVVAKFEKLSFEQFKKDHLSTFDTNEYMKIKRKMS